MKLKLKVILGAGALAAIPVIIACLTLGYTASKESQIALQHAAEEHLIAVRDLSKRRVEDYFKTINQQILNLSQNQLTIDAASSFTLGFSRYKKQAKANIEDLKAELSQYYEDQYLNEFKKRNNGKSIDVLSSLEQLSDDAIVLQHSMLQENQYPLGEKNKLADMGNYSSYNRSHKVFHPSFDYYLKQFGYYDIFIVDSETGNIVYSVFKELDYATSLINGPYKNSEIAKVFNKANQAKDESFVAISDFAPYSPSYNDPAAFIASPIFENGKKIAVLIFQMPIDNINQVMTHHHRWQEAGLGNTGETYLVAADKTLRSLNRSMIENKQTYLQDLKNASIDSNIIESIDAKNTSIGLQVANSPKINDALSGQSGLNIYTDYKGLTLLSAYAPISIKGLNWLILSEISVTEAFAPATKLTNEILYLSISLIVILVIVSLAIGYFFANATTAPIIKLSEAINDIQVNSDLTKRLEVNSQDEIGMAANSFNLMLEKFHHDILQVSKASLEIATVSEDTSVISRQTSSTIVDQKNQTQQVATAITKMSATLNDVSVNISHTAQASEKANIETNTGREMVEHTVTAIQELSEYIQSSSTIIDRVGDDSKKINSVMDVIRSIAEQTNLLALNAAIEAARAGEQGRGFAVVADEVRTLAGRTQQSTLEIQEMIENLQIGAEQAVTAMDKSNQKAQSVVEQANKAGDSLIVIAEAVARINDMSTQIASAAEQQNTVNEDINNNILSIHDLAEQTATGAEKTTTSTKKLSLLAEELNVMVKEFTV